jgi:uncharacterized protein
MRTFGYADPMLIPHAQLSPAALRAMVEEFVTRDGTDHSSVERRVEKVLQQLGTGSTRFLAISTPSTSAPSLAADTGLQPSVSRSKCNSRSQELWRFTALHRHRQPLKLVRLPIPPRPLTLD